MILSLPRRWAFGLLSVALVSAGLTYSEPAGADPAAGVKETLTFGGESTHAVHHGGPDGQHQQVCAGSPLKAPSSSLYTWPEEGCGAMTSGINTGAGQYFAVFPTDTNDYEVDFWADTSGAVGGLWQCSVTVYVLNADGSIGQSVAGWNRDLVYASNAPGLRTGIFNPPAATDPEVGNGLVFRLRSGHTHHVCGVSEIRGGFYDPADVSHNAGGGIVGEVEVHVPVPRLACGRTLRDLGGGQWIADVEAHVVNPLHDDPNGSDSAGEWRLSWSPAVYSGRTASIPLPSPLDPEAELWASFEMTRTIEQPVGFSGEQQSTGAWVDIPVVGGPVFTGPAGLSGWTHTAQQGNGHGSAIQFFDEAGGLPLLPELITQTKTVWASCSVRVSPAHAAEDGTANSFGPIIPPYVTGEDDEAPPPPPGSEDPEDACGGGSWWNPVTWAKSVFCGVLDLADLLKDLLGLIGDLISAVLGIVTGILDGIKDLFIPDSLDFLDGLQTEWSNKFPVSVLTQITTALGHVTDAVDEGMSSACGPTLDPDLSGAGLELPGATPADLDDLKISLPTPNDSCDQSDASRQLADLHGYRRPIRGFLEVFLVVGFLVRMAHSIGPGRTDATPNMDGSASR